MSGANHPTPEEDVVFNLSGGIERAAVGRRRVPPDAVTIDLDKLHASEQPLKATERPAPQGHVCPSGWCPVCQSTL